MYDITSNNVIMISRKAYVFRFKEFKSFLLSKLEISVKSGCYPKLEHGVFSLLIGCNLRKYPRKYPRKYHALLVAKMCLM